MRKLRRATLILAVAADLVLVQTGCVIDVVAVDGEHVESNDVEASQLFLASVPVDGLESLRVAGTNGTIDIRGAVGVTTVSVTAVKRVRSHSKRDAEDHLDLLRVRIRDGSGALRIQTEPPEHTGGRTYQVDYEIIVPTWFPVTVTNGNGPVIVEGIEADVDVKNGNGKVSLGGVEGSAWVDLGNGTVEASLLLPHQGVISFNVGNGGVDLALDPGVSAAFSAKVGNGIITFTGLSLTETVSDPRTLKGVLGSGSGVIDLTVGNGTIRVAER